MSKHAGTIRKKCQQLHRVHVQGRGEKLHGASYNVRISFSFPHVKLCNMYLSIFPAPNIQKLSCGKNLAGFLGRGILYGDGVAWGEIQGLFSFSEPLLDHLFWIRKWTWNQASRLTNVFQWSLKQCFCSEKNKTDVGWSEEENNSF